MGYIASMTSATKDAKINFRVSTEDAARIQAAAVAAKRSVADFVRVAVLSKLDKEKPNA
jgi:uncharacterized protein (DUF1778 family)